MLSFEGVLEDVDGNILYKKNQIKGGRFLYAYKDAGKAAKEEHAYLANAEKKRTFKPEPKKRGRKPKPIDLTSQKPKRPRGRPSKKQNSSADNL